MFFVNYTGPFGFIKPWTAVRDSETLSQQFLTPSIIAGIERKLFPELLAKPFELYKVKRHRLSYKQVSHQQEQIQPRGWNKSKNCYFRKKSILVRGVLIEPNLHLGFANLDDAEYAARQHICLCRNEDILLPAKQIVKITETEFDTMANVFNGFELIFERTDQSFLVGYNRFDQNRPMYGWLKTVGSPVKHIC
ncbi:hypothetical protein DO021_03635 [Desulfobacter hydrogenophilus]|uniref:Uncharacterized protein n=1 Tax=Desulfobacter hydrogenophilus TaxID=2291 RepID=A0A328FFF8_9BACT|nr:hypothetical protein [Desulfobacter hydrogenophilus]NDY70745.1 hypothetical protein [Desulfobacter hydrogenophilus]QBH12644.1 hypothetical protein EYB58_06830 [Desulfobacter hydrogenophilus]RAM03391.1 hypothetical protein DO021_03635 [Desulfobacter hydrogenophilus]